MINMLPPCTNKQKVNFFQFILLFILKFLTVKSQSKNKPELYDKLTTSFDQLSVFSTWNDAKTIAYFLYQKHTQKNITVKEITLCILTLHGISTDCLFVSWIVGSKKISCYSQGQASQSKCKNHQPYLESDYWDMCI